MPFRLLLPAMLALWSSTVAPLPGGPPGRVLHTRFAADRVYVVIRAANGARLEFYTDTGGGLVISTAATERVGERVEAPNDSATRSELGTEARLAIAPTFARSEPAPPLPPATHMVAVPRVAEIPDWPAQHDGILGQAWFAGHVWTWDYPERTLTLQSDGWTPGTGHEIPLGFRSEQGRRVLNFPRIEVVIDGEPLSMLLDTGAETLLTPGALAALHDSGPAFRATSMIAHSVFARWHATHPDWPTIDSAQVTTHSRMIRVPRVTLAGIAVGPVWFTERSDASYHTFMSSMTDRPVEGSLGGNALSGLQMTLDYPRARAWFVCRRDCRDATR